MARGDPGESLDELAHGYALTPRQVAVLRALIEHGGANEAALGLGLPYPAVRNTIAELKAKLGVPTVPMLIGLVLDLGGGAAAARRHDLFALSDRQFAIACGVGQLKSRDEIAERIGVSRAVVDAELKQVHLVLGVRNAGELARVVGQAGLRVPGATDFEQLEQAGGMPAAVLEQAGRTIGYSDHGPALGRPVLVLHSPICTRAPPTRLVAALQARGFRPLTIDRPGYGDTDPGSAGPDPHVQAAADVAAVCAAHGIARIDVIARSAGLAAVRLHQLQPGVVARAVLVNPTPAFAFTTRSHGPLGAVLRAFGRRPWAIAGVVRLLVQRQTPASYYSGMLRSFRGSAPDEALARDDPRFVADYLRAIRGFQGGRVGGYVSEQAAWVRGYDVVTSPGLTEWRIVQGGSSVMHDPVEGMAYWRARLPDTPVRWVADAGQMLAYSHPEVVVDALPG